jgi:glycosyltransferase involved in cell wall biosynthesis
MQFHFVCPSSLEPWDHRTPETTGISGSEQAIIELSRRLSRRGHDVTVYCQAHPDTPDDGPVLWRSLAHQIDIGQPGCWWLCRCPQLVDHFQPNDQQIVLHRFDDIHHHGPYDLTVARMQLARRVLAMSGPHRDLLLREYPFLKPDDVVSPGCGIASDVLRALPPVERDPFRLIYASSPDRGLEALLDIFAMAHAIEPRLSLHIYYGWQGYDTIMQRHPHQNRGSKEKLEAMPQSGVHWHGRVPRREILQAYQRSNVWAYPTWFFETGCVASMEAQALGCIPVCPTIGALSEKVRNGIWIGGDPADPLVRRWYRDCIVQLCNDPTGCHEIRRDAQAVALRDFDWERVVDLHEDLAGSLSPRLIRRDFNGKTSAERFPVRAAS